MAIGVDARSRSGEPSGSSVCRVKPRTNIGVYTEHPRLILTAQRLRLLKRERERESQRWRQFELLVKGSANLPEPGFALALYYAVSGDAAAGKRAVEWALGKTDDLRQLALVYDWCQPVLSPQQSAALAAKDPAAAQKPAGDGLAARRDRILALIATADDRRTPGRSPLGSLVQEWWRAGFAPSLADGRTHRAFRRLSAARNPARGPRQSEDRSARKTLSITSRTCPFI